MALRPTMPERSKTRSSFAHACNGFILECKISIQKGSQRGFIPERIERVAVLGRW